MKTTIKNTRTVKTTDRFFTETSAEGILSILMGECDPTEPIIIIPPAPKI
jgi:hypothetical protein